MIITMLAVQAIVAMVINKNHNMFTVQTRGQSKLIFNIERKNLNIDFFWMGMSTRFYKEVDQKC